MKPGDSHPCRSRLLALEAQKKHRAVPGWYIYIIFVDPCEGTPEVHWLNRTVIRMRERLSDEPVEAGRIPRRRPPHAQLKV